jgi:hypothetical protein
MDFGKWIISMIWLAIFKNTQSLSMSMIFGLKITILIIIFSVYVKILDSLILIIN